jgi:hypothetical protein
MVWVVQDFKTVKGAVEVIDQVPMPVGADPNIVRTRMASHFDVKRAVEGVRLMNEKGEEVSRWTWFDEQKHRQDEFQKKRRLERLADVKGHRLETSGDRYRLVSKDYNIVERDDVTLDEIEEFLKPNAP